MGLEVPSTDYFQIMSLRDSIASGCSSERFICKSEILSDGVSLVVLSEAMLKTEQDGLDPDLKGLVPRSCWDPSEVLL